MRSPRLAATVALAVLHATGYLALMVWCVVLLVGTATTPVVVDRGEQLEDLGTGYTLVAIGDLRDPGVLHDDSLRMTLAVCVAVGLLGMALVVLALRGHARPARPESGRVTRTG